MKLKAAVLYAAKTPLVVEEVDLDSPGPGEVKVRLRATAVCHSDIHFFDGDVPIRGPGIAGHEAAGIIDEVGAGVTYVKPGDHVVMAPITAGCGQCHNCLLGMRFSCTGIARSGPHHKNKKGEPLAPLAGPVAGFAEYTVVNELQTVKVPEDLRPEIACLLGCGVLTGFGTVVNRAKVRPFQSAVVIGVGGVGLNAIQGAAFSGAHPIIAVDVLDSKLEAAKMFGATHGVNATKVDPVEAVREITGGRGVDHAFIMVGADKVVRQAFQMLASGGSSYMVAIASANLADFSAREFISGRGFTGAVLGWTNLRLDVPRYIDIYRAGRLKLDELVTAAYPLDKINEAADSTRSGEALRNVITF